MTEGKPEAVAREALSFLWGARVQRIDGPSPTLFAFTLYDQGDKQTLVFSLAPPRPDLGLVASRPSGSPASSFVRRLRVAIENARLLEAHWLGGGAEGASAISLSFLRASEGARLIVDLSPTRPNLYLLGKNAAIIGAADERTRRAHFPGKAAAFQPQERAFLPIIEDRDAALTRGRVLLQKQDHSSDDNLRSQARAQAKALLKRLTRKAAAIREDLARAQSAPQLRREAGLLLTHLGTIRSGSAQVLLEDISCDPPQTLQVTLDPALSPQENAERRFARARRMQRGMAIAQKRLSEAEAEAETLSAFVDKIEGHSIAQLIQEAVSVGIKLEAAARAPSSVNARKAKQTHIPYRVFRAATGERILVGKGAADNDALTLTIARPHDLWLHARGLQGAHVIVQRERAGELTSELVLDAAHLAAHFSAARGEASAEVQHVERRYVRKPKGSAPGAVRVDRERVLLVRVEKRRLDRLLASEQKP
jgi:predicted ribosome quality control (RQC) complex YloA/Tae2 family protein